MTAGGLIQIVAVGEQDRYLTFDPSFTYFKAVYRKHTNFAIETIEEVFYNSGGFGKQARCVIPRRGDLVSNILLYIKLGSLNSEFMISNNYIDYGWVNSLGHALIKSVSIEIGGQRIDKQYGEWFEIWSELTLAEEQKNTYYEMIGKVDQKFYKVSTFPGEMELLIPLQFWFCRHYGLALPIMSLFYHHVELIVEFRDFDELWVSNKEISNNHTLKPPEFESLIYIDYVYLDVDERRNFYEESNIYLIEQLQCIDNCNAIGSHVNVNLDYLNHPVKELIWILQRTDVTGKPQGLFPNSYYPIGNDWFNYSTLQIPNTKFKEETFKKAKITFNGVDRFREKPAKYFRLYNPYRYHTRGPENYIYVYSFGLYPEELQPSGTMNFSRLSDSRLSIKFDNNRDFTDYVVRVYAINYNVLIISTGLGGLLFIN